MKRFLLAAALAAALLAPVAAAPTPAAASGSCYVSGYTRSDGRYVSGHYRSCPDSSTSNNWSSSGNTNPYTGERGYHDPYGSSSSSSWYSPSYRSWSNWP